MNSHKRIGYNMNISHILEIAIGFLLANFIMVILYSLFDKDDCCCGNCKK